MSKIWIFFCAFAIILATEASWYWPFGSDEDDEKEPPRLSELMEPASTLIDEGSDFAADGKVSEAVEKYRAALAELDRIEAENPDRVDKPEFATLKTKRAYVSAAIDTMLLSQARSNARPVAVSETSELEKKLRIERGELKDLPKDPVVDERKAEELPEVVEARAEAKRRKARAKKLKDRQVKKAASKSEEILNAIGAKNFAAADRLIGELLAANPESLTALSLKAVRESAEERFEDAERTLNRIIHLYPKHPAAYYNMALLYIQAYPEKIDKARLFYETARDCGADPDPELEEIFR